MPEAAAVGTILTAFGQLREWLETWLTQHRQQTEQERAAVASLLRALTATQTYIGDIEEGQARDRHRESGLAELWSEASGAFYGIDPELAPLLQIKSESWARPEVWSDEKVREHGATIERVTELTQEVLRKGRRR